MTNAQIKQMRLDMGLTQKQLAAMMGISKNKISYLETRRKINSDFNYKDTHRTIIKLIEFYEKFKESDNVHIRNFTGNKMYYIEFMLDGTKYTTIQRARNIEQAKYLFENKSEVNYDSYIVLGSK